MIDVQLKKQKRIIKRIILLLVLLPVVLFLFSLTRLAIVDFFSFDVFSDLTVTLAIALVIITLLYKPIDFAITWFLKSFVFRANINGQIILSQLARESITIEDPNELANIIVNTIGDSFEVQNASILLFNKEKAAYRIVSAHGINPSLWRNIELRGNHQIIELLKQKRSLLDQVHIQKFFPWQEANHLNHAFEMLHAAYIFPMMIQDELIGSVNLRPKSRSKVLSAQELKFFSEFCKEIARAFKNALLIDELVKTNKRLIRMQSELIHTTQRSAIEHLATGLAHEIHNPLTIISGKAQILLLKRNEKVYDSQVEEVLKTIVKQTKRAADITRKLLMFSESHSSVKVRMDLEDVINDTIALLSYKVSLDQIQVVKRVEPSIPEFLGNVSELREAFLNLFLNAVQAIGKQGAVHIDLRYLEQERVIQLKVKDSGPGIPKENLPKVFHPFFTTRPEATGLGLFVTQQIIHGYNGTINVSTELNKGTEFTVILPVQVEKKSEPKQAFLDVDQPSADKIHP